MENSILSLLNKQEQSLLEIKYFKKGTTIFNEGERCENISIIVKGNIDIISYSFSGKEIVFNSLIRNQIFGNNLLFSSDPSYKGNVISKSDSTIVFISKDNLLKLFQANQKFLVEYMRIQSDFGKSLNNRIKLLSYDSALERLEYYLFINNNVISFKSVSSLATILNLKRETLSRLLSKLEKENVIKRSLNQIIKLN